MGNFEKESRRENVHELLVKMSLNLPIPVSVSTIDGRIVDVNEAFLRMTGYRREELLGRLSTDVGLWKYPEKRKLMAQIFREKGSLVDFDNVFVKKNGEIGYVILYGEQVKFKGEPCFLIFNVDITERKILQEKLEENEKRYRALVENAAEGIIVVQKGQIRFANRIVPEKSGYAIEELLSMPFIDIVHPDDREIVIYSMELLLAGQEVLPLLFRIYNREGKIMWLESRAARIEWEGGPAALVFLTDVTEKRKYEDLLKFERNQLMSIFDSINHPIYVADPFSHEIIYVNSHIKEILGKDPTGRLCYKEFQGFDKPCKFCTNEIILRLDGKPYMWEHYNPIVSRHYHITDMIIVWLDGRKARFEIAIDITNLKKYQIALEESEEKYRSVVENATEGILVLHEDLIAFANPKASEIMGFSIEELISKPFIQLVFEDDRERLSQFLRIEDLQLHTSQIRAMNRNGELRLLEIAGRSINFHGIPSILLFLTDITEQKKLENEIVFLQKQFLQLQKMEAIGRFAGGIAHDFNNVLAVILGQCELLLFTLKNQDAIRERVLEIKKVAERASNLTRQLLAFSRRQPMIPRVFDISKHIAGLENMLKRLIGEDISLFTSYTNTPLYVKADPSQIEQVILNLAVNARDAMPRGGMLRIKTDKIYLDDEFVRTHPGSKTGEFAIISIADTGVGMTEEVKEKIFEPFFTTKKEGTGLGLSTVYGIVQQSDGYIWVESEPGRGTEFHIYLPLSETHITEEKKQDETKFFGGQETILVVEDDKSVREIVVEILKRQGFKVFDAENSAKALYFSKQYRDVIHLVITDVVMPDMNGRELSEAIRKIHPEAKVLFMSGYATDILTPDGIFEEDITLIQKPFSVTEFLDKIRKVLKS